MKLNKIVAGFAFAATLTAGQAMAATQGTVGVTSTGSTDVSLEIADMVQISGVDNIALGAWAGTGDMTGVTEFCVYRSAAGNYKVTLTASTGAFQVTSATTTDNIAFTPRIDDDLDATDGESLTYNTASAVALVGSSSYTCGGGSNAELHVTFAEAALQTASTANDYTATVTVLVEPI